MNTNSGGCALRIAMGITILAIMSVPIVNAVVPIIDDFEDGSLSEWTYEILVTWAPESFSYGIVDDNGNKVTFIKGGIDNGGGGGQVLVRNDLNSSDSSIKSHIKMVLDPNFVNYYEPRSIAAGVTGRYESTGKGYGAFIDYDIANSIVYLKLYRFDGTQPGPNYEYNTRAVSLNETVLSNFDPLQWHTIQLDLQDSSIIVKLDDFVYLRADDNTYVRGSPGLLFWGSQGDGWAHYDDFAIGTPQNSIGYSATVATGQNTFIQSSNGAFGTILTGTSKVINSSVVLNNTGDLSASVDARFTDDIGGIFGLISGANVLAASNFELRKDTALTWTALNSSGTDVYVTSAPPSGALTVLDARLTVPEGQPGGAYSGTVVLTFGNEVP